MAALWRSTWAHRADAPRNRWGPGGGVVEQLEQLATLRHAVSLTPRPLSTRPERPADNHSSQPPGPLIADRWKSGTTMLSRPAIAYLVA